GCSLFTKIRRFVCRNETLRRQCSRCGAYCRESSHCWWQNFYSRKCAAQHQQTFQQRQSQSGGLVGSLVKSVATNREKLIQSESSVSRKIKQFVQQSCRSLRKRAIVAGSQFQSVIGSRTAEYFCV